MNIEKNNNDKEASLVDKAVKKLEKKPEQEKSSLSSYAYSTIAKIVFGIYIFGGFVAMAEWESFGIFFVALLLGYLNYLLLNWFGLVLKGLESNNLLLEKLVDTQLASLLRMKE